MSSTTKTKATSLTEEQRLEITRHMDAAYQPMRCFVDLISQCQWERERPTIEPWHFGTIGDALMQHAQGAVSDALQAGAEVTEKTD